jgi:hypothetical protein
MSNGKTPNETFFGVLAILVFRAKECPGSGA